MSRTLADSLGQISRQRGGFVSGSPGGGQQLAVITRVNYVNRRVQVRTRGYAGPKAVRVSRSVALGTVDAPKVFAGDIAVLDRSPQDGRWLCVAIQHKAQCPPPTGEEPEVVVEGGELEVDSLVNSWQANDYGSSITPLDLFFPPIETLGQLSLLGGRYDTLCGIPFCQPCGVPTAGQTWVYDAVNGCWKLGFRLGGCLCVGSPVQTALEVIDAYTGTIATEPIVFPAGNYCYVWWKKTAANVRSGCVLSILDVSDAMSPTLVGDVEYTIPNFGQSTVFASNFISGIAKQGDYIWVTARGVDSTASKTGSRLLAFDVSTPTAPFLRTEFNPGEGSSGFPILLTPCKSWSSGAKAYLVALTGIFETGGNRFIIYEITTPASPVEISRTQRPFFNFLETKAAFAYRDGRLNLLEVSPNPLFIDCYDVSVPASPDLKSHLTTTDFRSPISLATAQNNKIFVGGKNVSAFQDIIVQFDYSDPSAPTEDERSGDLTANDGAVRALETCGAFLFSLQRTIVAGNDAKIRAWTDLGTIPSPLTLSGFFTDNFKVDGTHLYLGGGLDAVPSAPAIGITTC